MLVMVDGPLGPEIVSVVKKTLVLKPPAPAVVSEPVTLALPDTVVVGGRPPLGIEVAVKVVLTVESGPPGWTEPIEVLVKEGGETRGVEYTKKEVVESRVAMGAEGALTAAKARRGNRARSWTCILADVFA